MIANISEQSLKSVAVQVTLKDGDTDLGEFIDTSDGDIDSLPAGEQWGFKVTIDKAVMTSESSYTISVEADPAEDETGTGTGTETGTGTGTGTETTT